jgi:hypothetical protein
LGALGAGLGPPVGAGSGAGAEIGGRMNDDLRHFHAEDDVFQRIPPDACVVLICALAILALIFWPYIK